MRRDRAYRGQAHSHQGERGKTEIHGITFRDLVDAAIRSFHLSSGGDGDYMEATQGERASMRLYRTVSELDLNRMSPIAFTRNLCCEVERIMGIFPNVPQPPHDASIEEQLEVMGAPLLKMQDLEAALDDIDGGGDGRGVRG